MTRAIWPKHFLIRTCGLYGYTGSRDKGTNFVEAMIQLGKRGSPVRVVSDQVCTPTSTMDVAQAVRRIIRTGRTDERVPLVRCEPQDRTGGVPAVADSDLASLQIRHLDAVAVGKAQRALDPAPCRDAG